MSGLIDMKNSEMIKQAAHFLGIAESEAAKNNKNIEGTDLVYFWNSQRGGRAVIIAPNGEKLVAASGVSFDKHLEKFREGMRN